MLSEQEEQTHTVNRIYRSGPARGIRMDHAAVWHVASPVPDVPVTVVMPNPDFRCSDCGGIIVVTSGWVYCVNGMMTEQARLIQKPFSNAHSTDRECNWEWVASAEHGAHEGDPDPPDLWRWVVNQARRRHLNDQLLAAIDRFRQSWK